MKNITAKAKVEMAKQLAEIIQERKDLEKKEKTLKEFFKAEIGDSGAANVGDILITLEDRSRESVDKKSIEADMGREWLEQYLKTSSYQMVSVKNLKKAA